MLRPAAVASHVVVLAVVAVCLVAGQWQLGRLAEVREHNDLMAARLSAPAVDLDRVAEGSADELAFRRVTMTGTYRPSQEVLQRNQSWRNEAGFHVLTPFETTGGLVVLVRRGWVPASMSEPPVQAAAPPSGSVQVEGVLEPSVDQPGFGARDPAEGELARVFHADTDRLDRQIDGDLFELLVRLDTEEGSPTLADLPFGVGSPALDERNHLSYAVQWHAFAAIALVTYGAWLYSRRRQRPA